MHGSVEVAPKIGIADAICDIVSTGATLKENGLEEMQVIMHSEAVLVANKNINKEIQDRVQELIFRIQSVSKAKGSKYIMLHIDKSAISQLKHILPGCETPTVLNLHGLCRLLNKGRILCPIIYLDSILEPIFIPVVFCSHNIVDGILMTFIESRASSPNFQKR